MIDTLIEDHATGAVIRNAASPAPPAFRSASVIQAPRQGAEVKVALIAPMSGAWARQGELMKKGGDLAIKHINEPAASSRWAAPR